LCQELARLGGRPYELAGRTPGADDQPIFGQLSADRVHVDPVHLRRLSDLIVV